MIPSPPLLGAVPSSLTSLRLLPPTEATAGLPFLPATGIVLPKSLPIMSAATLDPDATNPTRFSVASSFPPIPAKLVKKIQTMEFVEMRELLPDNVALAERLEALPSTAASNHAPLREVASITSWTCAFATYIAVVAQAHPARVCDMLAYMRLIRTTQCFGKTIKEQLAGIHSIPHCIWPLLDAREYQQPLLVATAEGWTT